nr:MAG TPA: hypothetical protein [Bacteriophage sp.]
MRRIPAFEITPQQKSHNINRKKTRGLSWDYLINLHT